MIERYNRTLINMVKTMMIGEPIRAWTVDGPTGESPIQEASFSRLDTDDVQDRTRELPPSPASPLLYDDEQRREFSVPTTPVTPGGTALNASAIPFEPKTDTAGHSGSPAATPPRRNPPRQHNMPNRYL